MSQGSRLALAILATTLLVAPVAALHPALSHLSAAGFARLSLELTHPMTLGFLALALVSILPAAGFALAIGRGIRGMAYVRTLTRNSLPVREGALRYRILPADTISVFTAGIFRPVTFVTAGAERALGERELRAALLHEAAHRRRRDVFWRLLLQAVGQALAFVPWVRRLVDQEALRSECAADEYAVRGGASRLALFEAIVAASAAPSNPLAVGLTSADVEFRLMRLVDPALPLPGRPTRAFAALTAAVAVPAVAAHAVTLAASVCTGQLLM